MKFLNSKINELQIRIENKCLQLAQYPSVGPGNSDFYKALNIDQLSHSIKREENNIDSYLAEGNKMMEGAHRGYKNLFEELKILRQEQQELLSA